MVFLVYATAAALALILLYCYHTDWYWHGLSLAIALAIGLVPPQIIPVPATWGTARDLIVGFVFVFLTIWGLGVILFRHHHPEKPNATHLT